MTLMGLVARPGSNDTVWVSHTIFCYGEDMKELNIFIDESVDFGKLKYQKDSDCSESSAF